MAETTDFWKGIRFLKRFCLIDFGSARFLIMKKHSNAESANIAFRDIHSCFLLDDETPILSICSKTFCYPFCVKTRDRTFMLFATTAEERQLWIDGFNYVVCSTKQVQSILDLNEK